MIDVNSKFEERIRLAFASDDSRVCVQCGTAKSFEKFWARLFDMRVAMVDLAGGRFLCSRNCSREFTTHEELGKWIGIIRFDTPTDRREDA